VAASEDTGDAVALWRLQAAYADIVSRRAWSELDTVFRADTTVEIDTVSGPVRTCVGAEEFTAFVGPAVERFDHFQFVILNTVVDVDGPDSAHGRIFMCEVRHEIEINNWTTAYGIYQDRYRRVDGRWWFASRRYRSMARTGPQAGIFGLPPDLPLIGR
jgi:hypothetical protein